MRKFAAVAGWHVNIPERKTAKSAGYDIEAATYTCVMPGETVTVSTGLKAYMEDDEVLHLYLRSSSALKRGMRMANHVGVIDADYVDNPDNEGHIGIPIWNTTDELIVIMPGERIAQGVFVKFLTTDDDQACGIRIGGVGSTGV
jgi:dUTP pyrophosphatase